MAAVSSFLSLSRFVLSTFQPSLPPSKPTRKNDMDIQDFDYHRFRHYVLEEIPEEFATEQLMLTAGRIIHGNASLWRLFGLDAREIVQRGIKIRSRTLVECMMDSLAIPIARDLNKITETERSISDNTANTVAIYDLFGGSGNFSFHLSREIKCILRTSEMDPSVFSVLHDNFQRLGMLEQTKDRKLQIENCSYAELLKTRKEASGPEVYIVDPPFGSAFSDAGMDFTKTSPSLPQILQDIGPSNRGVSVFVVLKGTDNLIQPAFDGIWTGGELLTKISVKPELPFGKNAVFYVYRYMSL